MRPDDIAGTNLCLSWNWSNIADFATFQRVNDTTLSNVRVSDETDRYLLLVGMQLRKLSEELDKRAFTKGMIGRSMEGDGWVAGCEVLDISRSDPVRHEVALIDNKDHLFMSFLFSDEFENAFAERA